MAALSSTHTKEIAFLWWSATQTQDYSHHIDVKIQRPHIVYLYCRHQTAVLTVAEVDSSSSSYKCMQSYVPTGGGFRSHYSQCTISFNQSQYYCTTPDDVRITMRTFLHKVHTIYEMRSSIDDMPPIAAGPETQGLYILMYEYPCEYPCETHFLEVGDKWPIIVPRIFEELEEYELDLEIHKRETPVWCCLLNSPDALSKSFQPLGVESGGASVQVPKAMCTLLYQKFFSDDSDDSKDSEGSTGSDTSYHFLCENNNNHLFGDFIPIQYVMILISRHLT